MATPGSYLIQVRAANLSLLGEIDQWENLVLHLRRNKTGAFAFAVPASAPLVPYLAAGNGVVISRNGTVLLSGPFRVLERQWTAAGDQVLVSGPDDLCWLEERLASPVPSAAAPPFSAQAYDIRSGVASTVLRQYVNVNAGPGAAAGRAVPGLTLGTDPLLGPTVSGRARFNSLLYLLQQLAIAGGDLGFSVVQQGTSLVFGVTQATDRTATAQFAPDLGNLQAFSYKVEAPTANLLIAGDASTGLSRQFYQSGDAASAALWGARIEAFLNQSNTTTAAEIQQAIAAQLVSQGQETTLQITPIDTDALAYNRDYFLGDRVTVNLGETLVQDTVREVVIEVSVQDGELITPMIGTTSRILSGPLKLFGRVSDLVRRINLIETS